MKTKDVLALHAALQRLMADPSPKPVKFAYALTRNLRTVEGVVTAFQDALRTEASEQLTEYENERIALVQTHAQRNAAGEMITDDQNNAVLRDPAAFAEGLKALGDKYPDAQVARVKHEERLNELLEADDDTIRLHKVSMESLPPTMDMQTMAGLLPIILEEPEVV